MDIPVLLEPTPTGWRASTGAPLNLTAEGPDRDAVLADLRAQSAAKLTAGATIVPLSVPAGPLLDIAAIRALAAEMASDPCIGELMKGIAEYRAEVNVRPECDDDSAATSLPPHTGRTGVSFPDVAPTGS